MAGRFFMRHLSPDELIDLADGTRAEASAPHLRSCDLCLRQLADLRATMAVVSDLDVPEPSPLFWDHLSARVREAVKAEGTPRRTGWLGEWASSPWTRVSAGAVALVMLAAVVTLRVSPISSGDVAVGPAPSLVAEAEVAALDVIAATDDDPSLALVADLAGDLDWDTATEAGLTLRVGGVDGAVSQLTDGERQELHRLLTEQLGRSGA